MRVLILNTSERTGGAAIAANRLCAALNQNGVHCTMLVRDRQTDNPSVVRADTGRWPLLWERLRVFVANGFNKKDLWQTDLACVGGSITETDEFRQADVIHLHWINQGFLSLGELDKILHSGKRIVWTLHDQWPVTGVCHYSASCEGYKDGCTACPQMRGSLAAKIFNRKRRIYAEAPITFVGCSQWIAQLARQSLLAQGHRVVSIPNALPQDVFAPVNPQTARMAHGLPLDMRLILFSAFKVTDERKGFRYLAEALRIIQGSPHPVALVVVGRQAESLVRLLPPAVGEWGGVFTIPYISDERRMAQLYAAADVFVTPSLEDNLPNTIAEAMSTGTPCVGFDVGGIPEMIDHKQNGYVARRCDARDLAAGIEFCLTNDLRAQALRKATQTYNESSVARQYIALYESE